jgi:hypothetical protein
MQFTYPDLSLQCVDYIVPTWFYIDIYSAYFHCLLWDVALKFEFSFEALDCGDGSEIPCDGSRFLLLSIINIRLFSFKLVVRMFDLVRSTLWAPLLRTLLRNTNFRLSLILTTSPSFWELSG